MNMTGVGFVFLLGICLALPVSCAGDAEEPGQQSPTATASPTATLSSTPLATPPPSPTATAPSSPTPILTATGGPTLTAEESSYYAQINVLALEMIQAMDDWNSAVYLEPLFDQAWQDALARVTARFEGLVARLAAIEPPERFAKLHSSVLGSTTKWAEAARKAGIAGTNRDAKLMEEAAAAGEAARQSARDALDEINRLFPEG
jgi:hypothetical protein